MTIFTAIVPLYSGACTEIIKIDGGLRLFLAICQVQFTKTPIFIKRAYHWQFSWEEDIF